MDIESVFFCVSFASCECSAIKASSPKRHALRFTATSMIWSSETVMIVFDNVFAEAATESMHNSIFNWPPFLFPLFSFFSHAEILQVNTPLDLRLNYKMQKILTYNAAGFLRLLKKSLNGISKITKIPKGEHAMGSIHRSELKQKELPQCMSLATISRVPLIKHLLSYQSKK